VCIIIFYKSSLKLWGQSFIRSGGSCARHHVFGRVRCVLCRRKHIHTTLYLLLLLSARTRLYPNSTFPLYSILLFPNTCHSVVKCCRIFYTGIKLLAEDIYVKSTSGFQMTAKTSTFLVKCKEIARIAPWMQCTACNFQKFSPTNRDNFRYISIETGDRCKLQNLFSIMWGCKKLCITTVEAWGCGVYSLCMFIYWMSQCMCGRDEALWCARKDLQNGRCRSNIRPSHRRHGRNVGSAREFNHCTLFHEWMSSRIKSNYWKEKKWNSSASIVPTIEDKLCINLILHTFLNWLSQNF